jgi:8-oxo-dGTP pyrophosphatase MutT (NUDIX family)
MRDMSDIRKAAGIIIRDGKLLVTRTRGKDFFVAPGGKIETEETPEQALCRELHEELGVVVREDNLESFGIFTAPAAGQEDHMLYMDVFTVMAYEGDITPSHEVEEIRWVGSDISGITLGSIFAHDVIPRLAHEARIG